MQTSKVTGSNDLDASSVLIQTKINLFTKFFCSQSASWKNTNWQIIIQPTDTWSFVSGIHNKTGQASFYYLWIKNMAEYTAVPKLAEHFHDLPGFLFSRSQAFRPGDQGRLCSTGLETSYKGISQAKPTNKFKALTDIYYLATNGALSVSTVKFFENVTPSGACKCCLLERNT